MTRAVETARLIQSDWTLAQVLVALPDALFTAVVETLDEIDRDTTDQVAGQ